MLEGGSGGDIINFNDVSSLLYQSTGMFSSNMTIFIDQLITYNKQQNNILNINVVLTINGRNNKKLEKIILKRLKEINK